MSDSPLIAEARQAARTLSERKYTPLLNSLADTLTQREDVIVALRASLGEAYTMIEAVRAAVQRPPAPPSPNTSGEPAITPAMIDRAGDVIQARAGRILDGETIREALEAALKGGER